MSRIFPSLHVTLLWLCVGSVIALSPIVTEIAYAQSTTGTGLTSFSQFAAAVLTFIHLLTIPLLVVLNYLLDPNTVFVINETGLLLVLWQLSRDIMNIIFAFILIGSAIYTIIRAGSSSPGDFFKQFAGKFILAVILINFSWFAPRVILDVSAVLTATVYGLPDLVGGECLVKVEEPNPNGGQPRIVQEPCEAIIGFHLFQNPDLDPDARHFCRFQNGQSGWQNQLKDLLWVCKVQIDDSFRASNPALGTLNGLVVGQGRLLNIPRVRANQLAGLNPRDNSQLTQLIKLLMNVLIALTFQIALSFPIIALALAFLIRIPIIWLTVAFMPFAALSFVVELPGFNTRERILNTFLTAAFLPVITGIPIAVGYILITAATSTGAGVVDQRLAPLLTQRVALIDGVTTGFDFIWFILAILVVYIGVFAALRSAASTVEAFNFAAGFGDIGKQFASRVGRLAAGLPILPVPKGTVLDRANGGAEDGRASFSDLINAGRGSAADRLRGSRGVDGSGSEFSNLRGRERDARRALQGINGRTDFTDSQVKTDLQLIRQLMQDNGFRTQGSITLDSVRDFMSSVGSNNRQLENNQDGALRKLVEALRNTPPSRP